MVFKNNLSCKQRLPSQAENQDSASVAIFSYYLPQTTYMNSVVPSYAPSYAKGVKICHSNSNNRLDHQRPVLNSFIQYPAWLADTHMCLNVNPILTNVFRSSNKWLCFFSVLYGSLAKPAKKSQWCHCNYFNFLILKSIKSDANNLYRFLSRYGQGYTKCGSQVVGLTAWHIICLV